MARGPGSAACGLAQDNLHRPRAVAVIHQQSLWLPLPPAGCSLGPLLLLSFPVCQSVTRQECSAALLLKHLVLDNLWIIANSR